MKIMQNSKGKPKGSAILITFFVMLIILTIALSLVLVTIKNMKGSTGASKSSYAYQKADEGVEEVMYDILKTEKTKVKQLENCISASGLIGEDGYLVELLDGEDKRIYCNSNDANIDDIKSIKSIGTNDNNYQKSERAIKVPVNKSCSAEIASDENLKLLLHLEETSGSGAYLKDSSSNGNDATPSGTSVDSGICNARSFNGSSDYIKVDSSGSLDTKDKITIEAWIKPEGSSYQPIIEYNNGSNWGVHLWQWDSFGKLYANLVDTSGGSHPLTTSGGLFTAGNWYYVAVTYDSGNNQGRLFVNDQEVLEQNVGSFNLQTSYDLYIGKRSSGSPNYYFNGIIDEVRISDEAKSISEIKADFCAGCAKLSPEPSGCSGC